MRTAMKKPKAFRIATGWKPRVAIIVILSVLLAAACANEDRTQRPLRGASSYTPYDAHSMLWARNQPDNIVAWVSSGGEAGRLLVAGAEGGNRPDWVLCTQGVVAGLAARGETVCIIGTVYQSDEAILPVYRVPRPSLKGSRSLFIPRSSIEFAFDRLLTREGLQASDVRVPEVGSVGFSTIKSLLAKPVDDADALDFAILVDPFTTNLLTEQPGKYEVGSDGLYNMHYSLVVRMKDLRDRREAYLDLLRDMIEVDLRLQEMASVDDFYAEVWGRERDGLPERLPPLQTFSPEPLSLGLDVQLLRDQLDEELRYLVEKYPNELQMPESVSALVDPSLLVEVAPDRVR